jgi:hypothetical protein
MRLIDRIALKQSINMLLNFILKLISIFAPKPDNKPTPEKKIWFPRIRRKTNETKH